MLATWNPGYWMQKTLQIEAPDLINFVFVTYDRHRYISLLNMTYLATVKCNSVLLASYSQWLKNYILQLAKPESGGEYL